MITGAGKIHKWMLKLVKSGGLVGKEPACNAGDPRDMGSIPGSGRSPGRRNGNPPQYFCLQNPVDRVA